MLLKGCEFSINHIYWPVKSRYEPSKCGNGDYNSFLLEVLWEMHKDLSPEQSPEVSFVTLP